MKKRVLAILLSVLLCLTIAAPAALAARMGDLNGDNNVTAADARLALRAAVGLDTLCDEIKRLADADGNDQITAADARLILRAAVGLENLPEIEEPADVPFDYDAIPDETVSADGTYELAFVQEPGAALKDGAFNESVWNGVKRFAVENEKTCKYYVPENGENATDDDMFRALETAAANGAKAIAVCGFLLADPVARAAAAHPDVQYLFVDGWPMDNEGALMKNVTAVTFAEAEAGFLAGYAAVYEGCASLGFSGAGGGENPVINLYRFGFLQGANAAAKELDKTVTLRVSYRYGESFSPSPELEEMLRGWYRDDGVEAVMSCGGGMIQSAVNAANAEGGRVIGVDSDTALSYGDVILTSAAKNVCAAIQSALALTCRGEAALLPDCTYRTGIAEGGVYLPDISRTMTKFTPEAYAAMTARFINGDYAFCGDLSQADAPAYRTNVNVITD